MLFFAETLRAPAQPRGYLALYGDCLKNDRLLGVLPVSVRKRSTQTENWWMTSSSIKVKEIWVNVSFTFEMLHHLLPRHRSRLRGWLLTKLKKRSIYNFY